MPRTKSIDDIELIELLNEYISRNIHCNRISIPEFGKFVRDKGYEIQDYTIRRSKIFRKHLEEFNKKSEHKIFNDLVVYQTLDIDSFLAKNNTRAKLKTALIERDKYYANIASNAANVIKEKNELKEQLESSKANIEKLKNQLENVQAKVDEGLIKEKNNIIKKLRNILYTSVYPAIADTLLAEEGLLEIDDSGFNKDVIEGMMINAHTDISDVINERQSIKRLQKMFDIK